MGRITGFFDCLPPIGFRLLAAVGRPIAPGHRSRKRCRAVSQSAHVDAWTWPV